MMAMQFTIKSLMYLTAVAAAYAMTIGAAVSKSHWRSAVGIVIVSVLVLGKITYDERKQRKPALRERDEGAKRPD